MSETDLPEVAQAQLHAAVDKALSQPSQAQGFLGLSAPDLSGLGGYKDKAAAALKTVVDALDVINTYAWLIPDQYEKPLLGLTAALKKVQGWLK